MSRKRSGIDDLIRTLIQQHGFEEALSRARVKAQKDAASTGVPTLWGAVYARLKAMR